MEWLEPWWATDDLEPDVRSVFIEQLRLELSADHPLFAIPVRMIARGEGDDVLFELLDASNRVAVVHLTWAKIPETPPWPRTQIYADLAEFVDQRMLVDHDLQHVIDDDDIVE